jgi:hypothetical protein
MRNQIHFFKRIWTTIQENRIGPKPGYLLLNIKVINVGEFRPFSPAFAEAEVQEMKWRKSFLSICCCMRLFPRKLMALTDYFDLRVKCGDLRSCLFFYAPAVLS